MRGSGEVDHRANAKYQGHHVTTKHVSESYLNILVPDRLLRNRLVSKLAKHVSHHLSAQPMLQTCDVSQYCHVCMCAWYVVCAVQKAVRRDISSFLKEVDFVYLL